MRGYSGAAVSDWERGKSKINADERLVLVTMIKVLHDHGGLQTVELANLLLEAGNYRALDEDEARKIGGGLAGPPVVVGRGRDAKDPQHEIDREVMGVDKVHDVLRVGPISEAK
jgi:hypothetical protein